MIIFIIIIIIKSWVVCELIDFFLRFIFLLTKMYTCVMSVMSNKVSLFLFFAPIFRHSVIISGNQ